VLSLYKESKMYRIGKPKVALIPIGRPKKLSFKSKPVKIESKLWQGFTALVCYTHIEDLKPILEEVGARDYFLLDEERFISYQNLSDPIAMKDVQGIVKDKQIHLVDKERAKKEDFYLWDKDYNMYWILR